MRTRSSSPGSTTSPSRVTDLDRSVAWYAKVLGLGELMKETHPDGNGHAIVRGKPDWSMCVGLLTHESNAADPFQETRTGLDHVSFRVADRAELDSWAAHLDELGVAQSPIVTASEGGDRWEIDAPPPDPPPLG